MTKVKILERKEHQTNNSQQYHHIPKSYSLLMTPRTLIQISFHFCLFGQKRKSLAACCL